MARQLEWISVKPEVFEKECNIAYIKGLKLTTDIEGYYQVSLPNYNNGKWKYSIWYGNRGFEFSRDIESKETAIKLCQQHFDEFIKINS